MSNYIYYKNYKNVNVSIHKDNESGIIFAKHFFINRDKDAVVDRLRVMCLNNDLKFIDLSKDFARGDTEAHVICCLKIFSNIDMCIEHISKKASSNKYSFIRKGTFVYATIGDKKYIYRLPATIEK